VDAHAVVEEEPAPFADLDANSERPRERRLELGGVGNGDEPIPALRVAAVVGAVVGDQLRFRSGLLT
jgi:hypothetical protein